MRISPTLAAALCLSSGLSAAQTPSGPEHDLLGKLAGKWVMTGTIGKGHTTHDVDAEWVLNEEYLEIREVSRDKDADGKPHYQAIIYLVWDPKLYEYGSYWMDTTGYGMFNMDGVGRAKPDGDRIPFDFGDANDGIHTVFAYDRKANEWTWNIDNLEKGKVVPFARLKLTRK